MTTLCKELAVATRCAVQQYNRMSGGWGTWAAPESWTQTALAKRLSRHYRVAVEPRAYEVIDKSSKARIVSGRIDIAFFPRTSKAVDDPMIGLVEVKKYAQNGCCADDAKRLRQLARRMEAVEHVIVVAYMEVVEAETLERNIKAFGEDVDIKRKKISVEPFRSYGNHCAAVAADLWA